MVDKQTEINIFITFLWINNMILSTNIYYIKLWLPLDVLGIWCWRVLDGLNINLWLYHLVIDVDTAWIFGFISTIWEIWLFYVYKHKKRRLFLVLWLRIWFIVLFKSIFTPAATLWIFEKFFLEIILELKV